MKFYTLNPPIPSAKVAQEIYRLCLETKDHDVIFANLRSEYSDQTGIRVSLCDRSGVELAVASRAGAALRSTLEPICIFAWQKGRVRAFCTMESCAKRLTIFVGEPICDFFSKRIVY